MWSTSIASPVNASVIEINSPQYMHCGCTTLLPSGISSLYNLYFSINFRVGVKPYLFVSSEVIFSFSILFLLIELEIFCFSSLLVLSSRASSI